jgi:hypothetical protein
LPKTETQVIHFAINTGVAEETASTPNKVVKYIKARSVVSLSWKGQRSYDLSAAYDI